MKHILITRPLNNILKTSKLLSDKGFIVSILPLTEIKAIDVENLNIIPKTIIVSSASSFIFLPLIYSKILQNIPLHCIGEQTAKAAYKYGLKQTSFVYTDAQDLYNKQPNLEEPILYLCGTYRTPTIELYLKKYHYFVLESYKTIANNYNLELLKQIKGKIDIALITSKYTAELLNTMYQIFPKDIKLISFSERISLRLTNFKNRYVAKTPNEQSAITLIENL